MNLTWQNDPDGYAVATLTTTGAVLAMAEADAPGPVQWDSRWIAEGGYSESATLQIDGQTARVLQGENAGQGLLVVWASGAGNSKPRSCWGRETRNTGNWEAYRCTEQHAK